MKKTFTYLLGGALFALFLLMPSTASATITAKWDFTNGATNRSVALINGTIGTVSSSTADELVLFVDGTSGKFDSENRTSDAQVNNGAIIRVPVASTKDVITILGNYSVTYLIGQEASNTTSLNKSYTARAEDVELGYVQITSKGDTYFYYIQADYAYLPTTLTAVWDWENANPSSITNATPEGEGASGSIASSISGISLDYKGVTSSDYAKLQYRSGENDAHFYTGTEVHIPVTSTCDVVTINSRSGYNYTVGGNAATSLLTTHQATSAEVTTGYVTIIATGQSYLYSITLEKRLVVTIGSTGWATFSNSFATDFTDITVNAKIVTGVSGSALTMTDVTGTAAANTGLLLNADEGTYAIPLTTTGTNYSSTNKLVAGTGAAVNYNSGAGYNYVLAKNGGVAVFQRIVEGTYGSVTVAKGKAYLALASNPGAHELTLDFSGGGSTDIQLTKDMGQSADGVYYNLAGQRVVQPTKGLYIVNGKKVVIR